MEEMFLTMLSCTFYHLNGRFKKIIYVLFGLKGRKHFIYFCVCRIFKIFIYFLIGGILLYNFVLVSALK